MLGPIAAGASWLSAAYFVNALWCSQGLRGRESWLIIVDAAALLTLLGLVMLAVGLRPRLPSSESAPLRRARFMAAFGATTALIAVVMIAFGSVPLILLECGSGHG